MKITRMLRSDCPSGIDCDRNPAELAALGLAPPPPGEAIVLIARQLASELVDAHEVG